MSRLAGRARGKFAPDAYQGDDGSTAAVAHPPVEELYHAHASQVRFVARRMLRNESDVEDVIQDVFVQVQRKLSTFRGEAALSTWLHRMTVNAALAHRRKHANRAKHHARQLECEVLLEDSTQHHKTPSGSADPQQSLLHHERGDQVGEAIDQLPEPYRHIVRLIHFEELSLNEAAERLSLSLPAVKSRLHRARMQLRDALTSYFA